MQLVGDRFYCGRSVDHCNAPTLEVSQHRQREVAGLTPRPGDDNVGLFKLAALIEGRPALGGINDEIELLRLQHVEFDTHLPCDFQEAIDFRRLWNADAQLPMKEEPAMHVTSIFTAAFDRPHPA